MQNLDNVKQRDLQQLKQDIHLELMERVNLHILEDLDPEDVRLQLERQIYQIFDEKNLTLNDIEREAITKEVQDEVLGLGPIEPLLADPSVSDILVNTAKFVYVERAGRLEKTDVVFQNNEHLKRIIDKIASGVGRRIDESSPMVDARLADGSRVNAIIPPLAIDGPVLSIRKFSVDPYKSDDLLAFKSLSPDMVSFISAAVQARVNILISGGTGSGKTTLLNVVSGFIPSDERIVSIEDSAELQLQQPHTVRLETRPPNIEGKGEIKQRELVRNSLRMRPDRIIVGEVRGEEALDMLQAMNTGHDGSLTTIHANSPRDALTRLEHMVGMSGLPIPPNVIRQQLSAALHLVISIERLSDGRRVVTSIQEITGMEESVVNMQEIYSFVRETIDSDGRVVGKFKASGIRPHMLKRFEERGISVDNSIFDPEKEYS
ncbi:MAG: CpaF family protein [Sinobacterium sp.]|nr:CpaF family protein [Sinobacterium sp.]